MPLQIGARLGPYEITDKIGAGGMGEVWRARDTRLNRTVAIKVSAEAFSARFEREARAVAALNHPNVCQLYDVGPDYLVLEYVEGMPVALTANVRKLLDLAVQIADGMAAAHAAGFVHRDLKPSNVLVTREGRAKILDFGLAKNIAQEKHVGAVAEPTVTGTGLIAGTAAYMSPEQVRGLADLDARSDQFSCGLVLYEMVTGKRPFERGSGVETMAAVVRDEPEPLPSTVPAPLRWIIERCLAKEPKDRYESSRDLYLELKSLRDHVADASSTQSYAVIAPPRRRHWRSAALVAVGAALAVAVTLLLGLRTRPPEPALRFTPLSFEPGGQNSVVWSPDSRAVAFRARQNQTAPYQVYVRNLDSAVATQLTRATQAGRLYWWTPAGQILFDSPGPPPGIWSMSAVGGDPELAFERIPNVVSGVGASTDDGTVAFLRRGEDGLYGIWTGSLPGPRLEKYEPAPFSVALYATRPVLAFSPDGRQLLLMWVARAGPEKWLMPYPADAARPPRRILEDLPNVGPAGATPQFSWMPDSRHVVISTAASLTSPRQLYVADTLSGRFRTLSSGTTDQFEPAVAPDGTKLAFAEVTEDFDIVSLNLRNAAVTPLLATARSEEQPAWAAARPVLAYVTNRNGEREIWLREDGQPDRPVVTARDFPPGRGSWFTGPSLSPDASRVIYADMAQNGTGGLWMSAVAGGAPVRLTTLDYEGPYTGSWSADGRSYAYTAFTEKQPALALKRVRTTGQAEPEILKTDVSPNGRWAPVWSPDGKWILYDDNGAKLISPDGQATRDLGSAGMCTFARTADRLYCLRPAEPDGSRRLVSINLEGGDERVIGTVPAAQTPSTSLGLSWRLSLTPDGNSVTYSTLKQSSNLWLIEGLDTVALP